MNRNQCFCCLFSISFEFNVFTFICSGLNFQIMGNNNSKPNKQVLEQQKLFENFPEPESIWKIDPKLTLFKSIEDQGLKIGLEHSEKEIISIINEYGCFDNSYLNYRLVVLTHGFRSNANTPWLNNAKNAILSTSNSNEIQVVGILDWGCGADIGLFNYAQAASNCLQTGSWLGKVISQIRRAFPQVDTYGIGHSLGAHLMGMAGRCSDGTFDRITGLDPAGPGFQTANFDKRLSRHDAELVDIIHTDGQDIPYYGTLVPLGDIDFYPNFGWNQPSDDGKINAKPKIQRDRYDNKVPMPSKYGAFISESHGRAIDFFIWSIQNPGRFRTHQQLETEPGIERAVHRIISTLPEHGIEVEMGYHLDSFIQKNLAKCNLLMESRKREKISYKKYYGNYYINTNGIPPWC